MAMYTHQIIHLGTGVRPQELRFTSLEAAETWLREYQVTQSYKDQNYRIVPINQDVNAIAGGITGVDITGQIVVVRRSLFNKKYQDGDRRFRVEGGFGCKPHLIGRAVYGTFVVDGEEVRLDRGDVEGLAAVVPEPEDVCKSAACHEGNHNECTDVEGNCCDCNCHLGLAEPESQASKHADPGWMNDTRFGAYDD